MTDNSAYENWQAYEYAREHGHRNYLKKATQCEEFYYGEQWTEEVRKKLAAQKRPALTINKVFSTLNVLQGEQIASAADISFRSTSSSDPNTAELLSKLWMHIANENKLRRIEEMLFLDGMIGGRGFFDVRMDFQRHLTGDVRISLRNPKNVVLDPDANEYDPKKWGEVFETWWYTWTDIARLYGEQKGKVFKDRKASSFSFGYDSIDERYVNSFGGEARIGTMTGGYYDSDPRVRRYIRVIERQHKDFKWGEWFVDVVSGDIRQVPREWDHNKISHVLEQIPDLQVMKRKSEVIQWVVTADDIELFKGESPYRSFSLVPYFPYFHHGRTMGIVEHLISSQELLNKSTSQELHVINTTANSGWKIKKNSLVNMTSDELEERGAETGLVMELDDVGDAEKIQPNNIPQGLDRIVFKADDAMKEVSGVPDSKRGFDRADVAAKAIIAKQRAGSINSMVPLSNLIHTRHILADKSLELVQDYYTDRRMFRITTGNLMQKTEDLVINDPQPDGRILNDLTIGEYDVNVVDVPLRDSIQDTVFQQAIEMRELGVQIPDYILIEASQLPNKQEVAQILKDSQGFGEPNENDQRMAQLEVEGKEISNELERMKVEQTKADVALKMARAKTEAVKAAHEESDPSSNQALSQAQQAEQQQQQQTEEMQLKRDQLELERERVNNEKEARAKELLIQQMQAQEKAMREARQEAEQRLKKPDASTITRKRGG